jgi:hypothetical protein
MKNVSANVGEIPPESIQGQLGTYVGEDDILRLVELEVVVLRASLGVHSHIGRNAQPIIGRTIPSRRAA